MSKIVFILKNLIIIRLTPMFNDLLHTCNFSYTFFNNNNNDDKY